MLSNEEANEKRPGPDDLPVPNRRSSLDVDTSIRIFEARDHNNIHIGPSFSYPARTTTDLKRFEILQWLSKLRFQAKDVEVRQDAGIPEPSKILNYGTDTGQWLLDSEHFDQWRERKIQKLWYIGQPGAGKTVLASIVINHMIKLCAEFRKDDQARRVAYMYLSYKEPHTLGQLIGSIVRQIIEQAPDDPLPPCVRKLWKGYSEGKDAPTESDLSELLRQIVEESVVYLVIDALDECQIRDRSRLLNALPAHSNLSVLVTSRHLQEFEDVSQDFKVKEIEANDTDLDLFIDREFKNQNRLSRWADEDVNLKENVRFRVKRGCQRMFLIASLQMKSLSSALTKSELIERSKNLPDTIEGIYELTLQRIEAIPEAGKKLAIDTLCWIVFACRSLTINELRHALATVPGSKTFDRERMHFQEDIRDYCLGLVTLTDGTATLVHYSAQTYLGSIFATRYPAFHSTIAQICVTYLSLDDLDDSVDADWHTHTTGHEFTQSNTGSRYSPAATSHALEPEPSRRLTSQDKLRDLPFLRYAAKHLGSHLRNLKGPADVYSSIIEPLTTLLTEPGKITFLLHDLDFLGYWTIVRSPFDTVCDYYWDTELASSESYPDIHFESDMDDDADSFWQSPLEASSVAAGIGPSVLVIPNSRVDATGTNLDEKETLQQRPESEIDATARSDRTADDLSDGQSLSEARSDVAPDSLSYMKDHDLTPLHLAAVLGWAPLIDHLARDKSCVDAKGPWGVTPIMLAVHERQWDAATTLLKLGASVDLSTRQGHAMLLRCVQQDDRTVVGELITRTLEQKPLRKDREDWSGFLLLIRAFILRLLLIMNGAPQTRDGDEIGHTRTPDITLEAHEIGQITANSRLANDAEVSADVKAWQSLLSASMHGDCELIERLIKDGRIDFRCKDSSYYDTAMFVAVYFDQDDAVKSMVKHGASVNRSKTSATASTLLHEAAKRDKLELVKFLIDAGAEVNAKDDQGLTAWSANLSEEHFEVLRLLVDHGADTNTKGYEGVSHLYGAAAMGRLDRVIFCLECGISPSITTNYGWTPLHWAASNGHYDCVVELLEWRANPSPISDTSKTPLDMVVDRADRTAITKVLREYGALTAKAVYAQTAEQDRVEYVHGCFTWGDLRTCLSLLEGDGARSR